jgi:class 3 adenylate cyclase
LAEVDGTAAARGFPDLERLLSARRLRFPGEVEAAFRADYAERWRSAYRAAFALGLATFSAFGVIDILAASHSLGEIWLLRFAVGVPSGIAVIALSYTRAFPRWMQPVGTMLVFVFGASIVGMEIVLGPDEIGYHLYLFGTAPVTAFGYAAPKLRFWYATTAGWAIWLATFAIAVDHGVWSSGSSMIEFAVMHALLAAVNIAGMIGAYLMESGSRRGFVQELISARERERSELLLRNILPGSVAERLKRGEDVAEAFDEATVLFADLVGFTPFAEARSPRDLMLVLNTFFSRFDLLADNHGLEKIKTIGDCYMAVCGVPVLVPAHAEHVADMAVALRDEVHGIANDRGWPFSIRIGIDTGPLIAGVIGSRKFSYDVWGDTVNTASRMQSCARPGEIMMTAATFLRLSDRYIVDGPTVHPVKGKGDLPTYVLLGRHDRPRVISQAFSARRSRI